MTEAGRTVRSGFKVVLNLRLHIPVFAFVSLRDQTDQLVDPIWLTFSPDPL